MKVLFTIHTKEKLLTAEAKALRITKIRIIAILKKPIITNKKLNPHQSLGKLNDQLSLVVIWKTENDIMKVITFYPAEKGRYESKILQRR